MVVVDEIAMAVPEAEHRQNLTLNSYSTRIVLEGLSMCLEDRNLSRIP